jgi:hypothetical protein
MPTIFCCVMNWTSKFRTKSTKAKEEDFHHTTMVHTTNDSVAAFQKSCPLRLHNDYIEKSISFIVLA